jgi:hypothetical protein
MTTIEDMLYAPIIKKYSLDAAILEKFIQKIMSVDFQFSIDHCTYPVKIADVITTHIMSTIPSANNIPRPQGALTLQTLFELYCHNHNIIHFTGAGMNFATSYAFTGKVSIRANKNVNIELLHVPTKSVSENDIMAMNLIPNCVIDSYPLLSNKKTYFLFDNSMDALSFSRT